ncbi:MAG: response regulator [bacterium]|nr:response regulator [bacterium]
MNIKPTRTRTLLLVEDTDILRDLLEFALESHHFVVVAKSSFAAGLRAIQKQEYFAIITDQFLGDGHGTDLLEEAKVEQPNALRYLMSSAPEPKGHCAHTFLSKLDPAPLQQRLLIAIEKAGSRK